MRKKREEEAEKKRKEAAEEKKKQAADGGDNGDVAIDIVEPLMTNAIGSDVSVVIVSYCILVSGSTLRLYSWPGAHSP